MPIPTPSKTERQEDYINRCIPVLVEKDKLSRKQASDVCYAQWMKK